MNLVRLKSVFAYLVLLSIVPLLGACGNAASGVVTSHKQSTYDRVINSGKIRCGYATYFPACIKDPNTGRLSGIAVEAIELIGKKLGLTVEWTEEVGWGSMLEGLQTDRYDIIGSAAWANANRAKFITFSKPLYYNPLFVYVKHGDKRFVNHLSSINSSKIKIATVDGETAQVVADEDFPKATKLSLPQMTDLSQVLLSVVTNKADLCIVEPATANQYLRNNPNTVEPISDGKPIRVYPNCWLMRRGEFEFKAMIDTVLDEIINSGAMAKIIAKYERCPHEVYQTALPYQMPKI